MTSEIKKKLSKIKMLVMDVDGVMTDARIFLDSDGNWKRLYSVRDGVGIVKLREAGYKTGIITGSQALDVKTRAEFLKVDHFFEKQLDKGPAFEKIKELTGFNDDEISYIGDDIFDVPLIKKVGLGVTVPDVAEYVAEAADYKTKSQAGFGAVRELCDMILSYGHYSSKEKI